MGGRDGTAAGGRAVGDGSLMPDVILHLGGNPNRVERTITTALEHPEAAVIISSESGAAWVGEQLVRAGVRLNRVIVDNAAYDTVGNLTTTWRMVRHLRARRVFVVTSDWHMPRAMAVARIAYWLRGVRPVACPWPDGNRRDPGNLRWDRWRTWVWRLTGRATSRGYRE